MVRPLVKLEYIPHSLLTSSKFGTLPFWEHVAVYGLQWAKVIGEHESPPKRCPPKGPLLTSSSHVGRGSVSFGPGPTQLG